MIHTKYLHIPTLMLHIIARLSLIHLFDQRAASQCGAIYSSKRGTYLLIMSMYDHVIYLDGYQVSSKHGLSLWKQMKSNLLNIFVLRLRARNHPDNYTKHHNREYCSIHHLSHNSHTCPDITLHTDNLKHKTTPEQNAEMLQTAF